MQRLGLLIAVSACVLPWLAGAATTPSETTIRQLVTIQFDDTTQASKPPSASERIFAYGGGFLMVRDGDQTFRFDSEAGQMSWTDETHRTRLVAPLPRHPSELLGEVSALRYLEQPLLRMRIVEGIETRRIAGHGCRVYLLARGEDASIQGRLWVATDMGDDGVRMAALAEPWWRLRFPFAHEEDIAALYKLPGPVLESEWSESAEGRMVVQRAVCAAVERGPLAPLTLEGETPSSAKDRLTYQELISVRLGPPPAARNDDERAVLAVIRRFQDGYRRRDLSTLNAWIDELMAADVIVLGTDGAWPGSWEWRSGHQAAREMFERDWRRWGSLKIFEDEIHLSVANGAAWVAAFATVVRDGGDDEASRQRAAARLRDHASRDWPSRRILYEAIADAAQVLVQYERDNRFVTPLRAEFGLIMRNGIWQLKMIHFSHPASGFRSFRLLNAPAELVRVPAGQP